MYRLTVTGVKRLDDGAEIPFMNGNSDYEQYKAWLAAGNTPEPMELPDISAQVVGAVQARLDAFARARGYDGILSACTYAGSTVQRFAVEGSYCNEARDAHWSACYDLLAQVQAGTRPAPTLDEVLALLPALQWPA